MGHRLTSLTFCRIRARGGDCSSRVVQKSKVFTVARVFSGSGGRLLAVVSSVAVAGAMFYAQGDKKNDQVPAAAPAAQESPVPGAPGAQIAAPAPTGQPSTVAVAPMAASSREADMLMASAPVAAPDFQFPLSPGPAPEAGLQTHTIWAARAIATMFLEIKTIGGQRQDPLPWHPNGLAIDVMIPNHNSPEGIELGNQIAGFALANAKRWGVLHVIWRQGFYPGIGAPSWTADYGNETANHFDHVHIATDGGGYPTGRETYYLGSMTTG